MRPVEAASLGAFSSHAAQVLPRIRQLLDAVIRDTEAMAACDAALKAVADYDAPRDEGCRPWTASLSSRDGDVKVVLTEGLDPIATAWPAKKYSKDLAPPRRSW